MGNKDNGARPGAAHEKVEHVDKDPIAAALRRLHDDVVAEPIPDDFMRLLAAIDEKREDRRS